MKLKNTGTWKISKARQEVKGKNLGDKIHPYAYRPFDIRQICYEPILIERNRFNLMKHLLRSNIALCTNKILAKAPFRHVLISEYVGDNTYVSGVTKERTYFFPLYLYPDKPKVKLLDEAAFKPERLPNFTPEFLQALKEALGTEPTPEGLFYYIYAVLYSPTYRKHYEELLKIAFPRVPLPTDSELFRKLSELGKDLVDLHLLKHPSLSETGVGFPESGTNAVERIKYDEENERVYFNKTQYFEGIAKEVWEYRIGAYQVLAKYLKDRKGRALTKEEIEHYMKVAAAIRRTIEVQGKVEKVYAELGGARNL